MSDELKQAELRGYSRGYAAGRRRHERDDEQRIRQWRQQQFRQQACLAILPALLRSNWGRTVDGVHKPYTKPSEFTEAAWHFADRVVGGTWFSGDLPTRQQDVEA